MGVRLANSNIFEGVNFAHCDFTGCWRGQFLLPECDVNITWTESTFSDTRKSILSTLKGKYFLACCFYIWENRWRRGGSLRHLISKPRLSTNPLAPNLGKIQNQKSQWVPHSEHWWFRIMLQKPEGWMRRKKIFFFFQEKGRQQSTWDDSDLSRVLTTHMPCYRTGWKDWGKLWN